MLFAVVDIETTGGSAQNSKITEIAIVITDGNQIIEEYESLVDPGIHIPQFITGLTGITNEMVEDAPDFNQIASQVSELLEGKIFVAHNVNFDYSFVKKQLEESGFSISPLKMCTVRYSRKIIPGQKSYSLGNISSYFGIQNLNAHRAMSDTKATVFLLHELLQRDISDYWKSYIQGKSKEVNLPSGLDLEIFNNLPELSGVYYLKNEVGEILYIGKAIKIKSRIAQHFSADKASQKSTAFHKEVTHIDYFLTGSEFLALLYEDSEIRKYWPPFNKAQKNNPKKFYLSYYKDQNNNWRIGIISGKYLGKKLRTAYSLLSAREQLHDLVKTYQLNPKFCQIEISELDQISDVAHNENFSLVIDDHKENPSDFVIWEQGRKPNESAFVLIKNHQFYGFGFIEKSKKTTKFDILQPLIVQTKPSGVSTKYISNYIEQGSNISLSIIEFNITQTLF
jgi:DNA polymerase-3 subunit epsilon